MNEAHERERSGYRFVGTILTPITEPEQIQAVESALAAANAGPLAGVREHLSAAARMLSDRQAPDYRNSIKESVSALESAVKVLIADE
jgi:hypothetical protein